MEINKPDPSAPQKIIPYGHQVISQYDLEAVNTVLKSDYLTCGPVIPKFEEAICAFTGAKYGIAVNSGTAALHAAIFAIGIREGDEVIVSPLTFAASANCVLYQGGKPVFADIDESTLLIDPEKVEAAITPKTKAIIGVDYAGQTCDWDALRKIADKFGLYLIADSCHALGAEYKGRKAGTLADITVFSFHPVKHITTGEGGMAVTDSAELAQKMRSFRNHGIDNTPQEREKSGNWAYDMTDLGYNYRITDFQCALGLSQLKNLDSWLKTRTELAGIYSEAFKGTSIRPLHIANENRHAWHLYVVIVHNRDKVFEQMRKAGIGVNVHYKPVYLHSYYQKLGYGKGICPVAERNYESILSLPMWVGLTGYDIKYIIRTLKEIIN